MSEECLYKINNFYNIMLKDDEKKRIIDKVIELKELVNNIINSDKNMNIMLNEYIERKKCKVNRIMDMFIDNIDNLSKGYIEMSGIVGYNKWEKENVSVIKKMLLDKKIKEDMLSLEEMEKECNRNIKEVLRSLDAIKNTLSGKEFYVFTLDPLAAVALAELRMMVSKLIIYDNVFGVIVDNTVRLPLYEEVVSFEGIDLWGSEKEYEIIRNKMYELVDSHTCVWKNIDVIPITRELQTKRPIMRNLPLFVEYMNRNNIKYYMLNVYKRDGEVDDEYLNNVIGDVIYDRFNKILEIKKKVTDEVDKIEDVKEMIAKSCILPIEPNCILNHLRYSMFMQENKNVVYCVINPRVVWWCDEPVDIKTDIANTVLSRLGEDYYIKYDKEEEEYRYIGDVYENNDDIIIKSLFDHPIEWKELCNKDDISDKVRKDVINWCHDYNSTPWPFN